VGGGALILLDTRIWVWWVNGSPDLRPQQQEAISKHQSHGLAISAISCWEVAKLVEKSRLSLDREVLDWLTVALNYPAVRLLPLTPEIAVESTRLPGDFHQDPADQIMVATARVMQLALLTADEKLRAYAHVTTLP
jgi:PIN domain nuclease of toxin-antitoxin system